MELPRRHTSCISSGIAELTQHVAQKKRRHVCASWGPLLLCTPWQNTHVRASGSMQTGWPRTGGGNRWRSQRSASHTSDWRQTEGRGRGDEYETAVTVGGVFMRWVSFVMWWRLQVEVTKHSLVTDSYLSTSSLATMSPFFRALMA